MNVDEYKEVINEKETYKKIREKLINGENVIIGWTDEEYTHYDILFSLNTFKPEGNMLQGGIRNTDLFVSIMGIGAFGFDRHSVKSPGYIAEKLNVRGKITAEKLAELINGVLGVEEKL